MFLTEIKLQVQDVDRRYDDQVHPIVVSVFLSAEMDHILMTLRQQLGLAIVAAADEQEGAILAAG